MAFQPETMPNRVSSFIKRVNRDAFFSIVLPLLRVTVSDQ